MKGKIFFNLILFLLILSAMKDSFSQVSKISFGVRGGLNLATTNTDVLNVPELEGGDFSRKMIPRFSAGLFADYLVSKNLSVQANVLYNQKGDKFEGTFVEPGIGIIDLELTNKYDYLSVPLFAKIKFLDTEARPYVIAGPEFSFLLSAKQTGDLNVMVVDFDTTFVDQDIKDQLESVEVAANFGAGLEFPIGNLRAFIEGRYGLGLTATNKEGEDKIKNNVIYINAGVNF